MIKQPTNSLFFLIVFFSLLFKCPVWAQDIALPGNPKEVRKVEKAEKKALRAARKEERMAEGKPWLTPFVLPLYTPEIGLGISGGGLLTFKTDRDDADIQRSTLPFSVTYSKKSLSVFGQLNTFWLQDRLRINAEVVYKNMDDNYFGVGYENARNTVKSDTTTAYRRAWWQVTSQAYYRLADKLYAGVKLDINSTTYQDIHGHFTQDEYYTKFGHTNANYGSGWVISYDSRDVLSNAWKGAYLKVSGTHYQGRSSNTELNGNGRYHYSIYELDARKYVPLGRKEGRTLALQGKGRLASGEVPYAELSQLGSPYDMRGYLWGHYRDRQMLYGLAEYRHVFYKRNGDKSRHGAVTWAGIGSIGPELSGMSPIIPNAGVGYRLEVQPRMNVRVDYGWGLDGSSGFYFNFTEVF